jgi:hypothetical protein
MFKRYIWSSDDNHPHSRFATRLVPEYSPMSYMNTVAGQSITYLSREDSISTSRVRISVIKVINGLRAIRFTSKHTQVSERFNEGKFGS